MDVYGASADACVAGMMMSPPKYLSIQSTSATFMETKDTIMIMIMVSREHVFSNLLCLET